MPNLLTIGHVSVASIRNYLFDKRIDKGDSIVLNPADYEHLLEDIKQSGEPIDVPLNVLGVLIVKDNAAEVPAGKIRVIKNESM
ncbi:hypothetical protein [Flavobacterium coralii]|uniref:hypothetical protein n=1 Tax=Flavobacterium coralii TaxID=2838017 RepID=UPI000C5DD8AC|nr:hypothetical protein [Flavobacterium sp.]|tara:strand:+ start:263 stop:514 length:252 start_codon:yes stop_codon:yes gene_type:complete